MLNSFKSYIKRKIVRKKIVPIVITDIESNLLVGKRAFITGGSSGIGFAIAKKFIASGCEVIIGGSDESKLKKCAEELNCKFLTADLNDIPNLKEQIINHLGVVDILVNSAGYHGVEKFGEITPYEWDKVMNINLRGMYFVCQFVSKVMIKHGTKGHILNVSSASALKPGWTPYEISKRAVNGLTLGFADKLIRYGIVVNGIAPGPTATPMLGKVVDGDLDLEWNANPSGRMSTVEEIANLALFMVSDLGNGIVGDTFFLTGGSGTICIDK